MLRTTLLLAIRTLRRYGTNTVLNLSGLAIALSACIIIFLVVTHEYSYDTYHANAGNIYQVVKKEVREGHEEFYGGIALPAKKHWPMIFPDCSLQNSSLLQVLNSPSWMRTISPPVTNSLKIRVYFLWIRVLPNSSR